MSNDKVEKVVFIYANQSINSKRDYIGLSLSEGGCDLDAEEFEEIESFYNAIFYGENEDLSEGSDSPVPNNGRPACKSAAARAPYRR